MALYLIDGEVDPKPRKLFIRDLLKLIETAKADNQDIILMGDFNEAIGDDPKMLAKIVQAGNLTDVHAHKHGYDKKIATYIRGSRRVDYCFVSPRIIDHVLRCGIEAFHARFRSDHRGYFVDISVAGLFDGALPAIVNPAERYIRSNHPRLVRKYIEKLSAYFEDHGIVKKAQAVRDTYNYEAVEKLDELITAGMLHAEHECRNDIRLPWSEEIHTIMTQVHILRIHLSSLKNNIDCTKQIHKAQIAAKQKSLKVQQDLPTSIRATTELLKSSQKDIRRLWKVYRSKQTTLSKDQEEAYIAQ